MKSRTTVTLIQSVVWSVWLSENKIFPDMSRSLSIPQIALCDDTLKMLLLFSKAGGNLNKLSNHWKSCLSVFTCNHLYIMMPDDELDYSKTCSKQIVMGLITVSRYFTSELNAYVLSVQQENKLMFIRSKGHGSGWTTALSRMHRYLYLLSNTARLLVQWQHTKPAQLLNRGTDTKTVPASKTKGKCAGNTPNTLILANRPRNDTYYRNDP